MHQNVSNLSSDHLSALGLGHFMCEQSYNTNTLNMSKNRTLCYKYNAKKIENI